MCSPDKGLVDSSEVTHGDLVETEFEIHNGDAYFIAETLNDSLCVLTAHRTHSKDVTGLEFYLYVFVLSSLPFGPPVGVNNKVTIIVYRYH